MIRLKGLKIRESEKDLKSVLENMRAYILNLTCEELIVDNLCLKSLSSALDCLSLEIHFIPVNVNMYLKDVLSKFIKETGNIIIESDDLLFNLNSKLIWNTYFNEKAIDISYIEGEKPVDINLIDLFLNKRTVLKCNYMRGFSFLKGFWAEAYIEKTIFKGSKIIIGLSDVFFNEPIELSVVNEGKEEDIMNTIKVVNRCNF